MPFRRRRQVATQPLIRSSEDIPKLALLWADAVSTRHDGVTNMSQIDIRIGARTITLESLQQSLLLHLAVSARPEVEHLLTGGQGAIPMESGALLAPAALAVEAALAMCRRDSAEAIHVQDSALLRNPQLMGRSAKPFVDMARRRFDLAKVEMARRLTADGEGPIGATGSDGTSLQRGDVTFVEAFHTFEARQLVKTAFELEGSTITLLQSIPIMQVHVLSVDSASDSVTYREVHGSKPQQERTASLRDAWDVVVGNRHGSALDVRLGPISLPQAPSIDPPSAPAPQVPPAPSL
jgi:hypothetical protein